MSCQSCSTPSEGEIVETESEKATTSLSYDEPKVDRRSRAPSVSKSPAQVEYPPRSRSRSRSPYRAPPRGEKRRYDDYYYDDRYRQDSRRFSSHYDNHSRSDRRRHQVSYADLDRDPSAPYARYDDRDYPSHSEKRPRTRSRSPYYSFRNGDSRRRAHDREDKARRDYRDDYRCDRYEGGASRRSREQSVSARGNSPDVARLSKPHTEIRSNQMRPNAEVSTFGRLANRSAVATVQPAADNVVLDGSVALVDKVLPAHVTAPHVDEAALIEERRRRREAIKAKYRSKEATPQPVQTPQPSYGAQPLAHRDLYSLLMPKSDVPQNSNVTPVDTPSTPRDRMGGQESPSAFELDKDENLANANTKACSQGTAEDEPSAADYDPTMDMQEDRLKHNGANEVAAAAYNETRNNQQQQDENTNLDDQQALDDDNFDMFADDDMFAVKSPSTMPPTTVTTTTAGSKAVGVPKARELDMTMLDDWDDADGYYRVTLGELLDGRYRVQANLGKGMFSGVIQAVDSKTNELVAIKLIRNNETMKKAGLKEIEILHKIHDADPDDKKHLIRFERQFEHKNHLCMVFEHLECNLREVLKKFGRNVGLNLRAVRVYAHQMFLALSLLKKCNILHADLKPDNILINKSRNSLKVCDLGSASDASDNEITPYLVSRFYRAPEIILGLPYDFAIDTWSIGCTLFELYTGKILFTGRTNNQMLRSMMECRGKFSHKLLRKAQFASLHFDDLLNFRSVERDKLTDKDIVRIMNFIKPTRDLKSRLLAASGDGMSDSEAKELAMFADLLDKCLALNPEKRCTPNEALRHPFVTRGK